MAMETARNRDALLLFISESPFSRASRGRSDFLSSLSVSTDEVGPSAVQKDLSGFLCLSNKCKLQGG